MSRRSSPRVFLFALLSLCYVFTNATWIQRTGVGKEIGSTKRWHRHGITSSSDGTKLAAVAYSGGIWTSTDSGATWNGGSGRPGGLWITISSSSDGTKLAAGLYNGNIWTSMDSGDNWDEVSFPGSSQFWQHIIHYGDGTKLAAVCGGWGGGSGIIYLSTNSGIDWAPSGAPTGKNWRNIASSSDGTKLAAVENAGHIWTSPNSGVTWTQGSQFQYWNGITSSSDGIKLFAVVGTDNIAGNIFSSSDSGANWIVTGTPCGRFSSSGTPCTTKKWQHIVSSDDATKLAAVAQDANIWTSIDSGANWDEASVPGTQIWRSITSSSDGNKLAASIWDGNIWTFDPNCYASSVSSKDGSDGSFYCINGGTIGGTPGSCTCTCNAGYGGSSCRG